MTHWKSWAKAGMWSYVDPFAILAGEDIEESNQARFLFELAVPKIPAELAGEGPLSTERRALVSDEVFLARFVDKGEYTKVMRKIRDALADQPNPEFPANYPYSEETIENLHKHEANRRFNHNLREFHLVNLLHAASCLEHFDLFESDFPEDKQIFDRWLQESKLVARRALFNASIAYCPSSYEVGHQVGLSIGGSGSFV